MWIEQNTCGLCGSVNPAFVINADLLKCNEIVLVGTREEIILLFCLCLQYNIRPDYYLPISDNEGIPEYCGVQLLLEKDGWAWGSKRAFVTYSNNEGISVISGEYVFYIRNDGSNKTNNFERPLLTYNSILKSESVFAYADDGIDYETHVARYPNVTKWVDKNGLSSLIGKKVIVCSDDVTIIEKLMENNEVFVDFEPYYVSATYIFSRLKKIKTIHLSQIDKRYNMGKAVLDGLDSSYQYLIAYDLAVGDQFRVLSRRKGTDYSKKRVIVSKGAKDLLKLHNINGLVLSNEQHTALITYLSMVEGYNSSVLLLGYRPLYPGIGWKSDLNTIIRTGASREYNLPEIAGLDCTDPRYSAFTAKPHPALTAKNGKSILLNPYGNNIRAREGIELIKSHDLMALLVNRLKDSHYTIYTNTPSSNQKEFPGTLRYEGTLENFVIDSRNFDYIISIFTGFIEVAMQTKSNLIVLSPSEGTRMNYSKLCNHDNYWEYDIVSGDIGQILNDILNIIE